MLNNKKEKLIEELVKHHQIMMINNVSNLNVMWVKTKSLTRIDNLINSLDENNLVNRLYLKIEYYYPEKIARIRYNNYNANNEVI